MARCRPCLIPPWVYEEGPLGTVPERSHGPIPLGIGEETVRRDMATLRSSFSWVPGEGGTDPCAINPERDPFGIKQVGSCKVGRDDSGASVRDSCADVG